VEPPPQREYAVYFEPDETELTEPAREELREIAGVLQRFPEAQVRIVGHTALFGTEEGRIEISRGRAQNVFQFLRREGWEPEAEPTVAWEASTDPVTLDREEQQLNRRVEIEIGSESTP
jgi:outer membrane protein OmpA-like peptidoglycan-associated protein